MLASQDVERQQPIEVSDLRCFMSIILHLLFLILTIPYEMCSHLLLVTDTRHDYLIVS